MPNVFTNITNLISSPPGQIAAGGVLAGIVWKFFEKVEAVLTENTKLEIAVWLIGLDFRKRAANWPSTFAKIFDRVFGENHFSWKCFLRSCLASYASFIITVVLSGRQLRPLARNLFIRGGPQFFPFFLVNSMLGNLLPDYVSLYKSRYIVGVMSKTKNLLAQMGLFVGDIVLTCVVGLVAVTIGTSVHWFLGWELSDNARVIGMSGYLQMVKAIPDTVLHAVTTRSGMTYGVGVLFFYPAFFTSIWALMYFVAGVFIVSLRRFDIGFQWFNRKFDIEHKPLSSIGLVAGAIVAVLWWTVVVVRWVV
jgi:hypothetical protein